MSQHLLDMSKYVQLKSSIFTRADIGVKYSFVQLCNDQGCNYDHVQN